MAANHGAYTASLLLPRTSLLNMIKRVPDDKTNRKPKKRLQHKVNNAAQTFLAKNAFLKLEITTYLLLTTNAKFADRPSQRY